MNTKQTCGENMARLRRGGKRVVIVVQRGLLLVDGLLEVDLDQVECHLGDVELEGEGCQHGLQEGQQRGQEEEEEVVAPAPENHDRDEHAQLGRYRADEH